MFYLGYITITVLWGTLCVLIAWALPYRTRFNFVIGIWTRMVLVWLRLTCGIRHEVHGTNNLPASPCVVFAKHESTWETLFLQTLLAPQATIIKKELLQIPFFGWAFSLLKPIAIDRREPRSALRKLVDAGKRRLQDRIWVVMFPEGTRTPPGQMGKFQAGGSLLAASGDYPVVCIAHNAGRYWPAHALAKTAGVIQVQIAEPIDTSGMSAKEISRTCEARMAELVSALNTA